MNPVTLAGLPIQTFPLYWIDANPKRLLIWGILKTPQAQRLSVRQEPTTRHGGTPRTCVGNIDHLHGALRWFCAVRFFCATSGFEGLPFLAVCIRGGRQGNGKSGRFSRDRPPTPKPPRGSLGVRGGVETRDRSSPADIAQPAAAGGGSNWSTLHAARFSPPHSGRRPLTKAGN